MALVVHQHMNHCVIPLQMLFLLMMLTVFVGQVQPKSKSVSVSLETKWASTPLLLETRLGQSLVTLWRSCLWCNVFLTFSQLS